MCASHRPSNRTPVCQPPWSGQNSSSTKSSIGGAPSIGNGPRANTEAGTEPPFMLLRSLRRSGLVLLDLGLDHLTPQALDASERAFLVLAHEAGAADHVRREDGYEAAGGHSGRPAFLSPSLRRSSTRSLNT